MMSCATYDGVELIDRHHQFFQRRHDADRLRVSRVRNEIPRGCVAGYMPELNVLCGIANIGTRSEQSVTKHLVRLLRSVVGRGADASVPRAEKQHAY